MTATEFAPNSPLTRGMLVTILYRYAGSPGADALANPFTDVPPGQWYTNAVKWAAANKVVTGVGQGRFAPNDNITREQLAVILYRYVKDVLKLNVSKTAELKFADTGSVSGWAADAVRWCYASGIIKGKDGNLFDPQGQATRAEAATMLICAIY